MFDLLVQSGLMTRAPAAADRTERWDHSKHPAILKSCDDFFVYDESGWSFLVGYQSQRDDTGKIYDRRRVLNIHFNSAGERDGALFGAGLIACGRSVRRLTREDRRARMAKVDPRYRSAWHDRYHEGESDED
jgi:hypothetical protein